MVWVVPQRLFQTREAKNLVIVQSVRLTSQESQSGTEVGKVPGEQLVFSLRGNPKEVGSKSVRNASLRAAG